ncbi:NADH-quinone oxidoreductase subunit NuoN [Sphingomicrobium astaxanthinifaciens]|uniref:NADH-quinone oxidoreductase subunit NuoN n=1 Tax=Sphingomicrobium astaxanthinifaciens TaxID=1227949 RepID=UPI001FCA6344|nr:NADH-quinone oxidoreductase subunit NuoN [Sphingomicrobium astaxanthinifaciens]MCJ7422162.1 NADH-quinone oxidoreductase subunit NuoN [Sphingomicrobium astaxanthinifaciens]
MTYNFAAILPELILVFGEPVLMLTASTMGARATRLTTWGTVALLLAATLAALFTTEPGTAGPLFGGLMSADPFAVYGKVLIYLSGAVAIIAADRWFGDDVLHGPEYPVLILLATVGMSVMVSATNLVTLYVGLELNSLAAYILASYRRTDARSAEAGLKYFVLGGLASGILLYGISLVYGFTATTDFSGIAVAFGRDEPLGIGLLFGLVFTMAGLAFKISAVPFHMWTPDVYEGAPTPVTTFFASAPKIAAVLLAARVCFEAMGPAVDAWRQIVVFAALASIFLGAIAAYGQTNIKRLLAYSSINNIGFVLIGLAAGTPAGASAMLFYMAIYTVMTLGAFLVVLSLKNAQGEPLEAIADLKGLSQTRPGMAAALAIFMFSLAGIPPLFGFWPKLLVFNAAVEAGLVALAVAGIVGTVVGAFYYLKVIKIMYFDEREQELATSCGPLEPIFIAIFALIVSPLGYLLIGPLGDWSATAAGALF